jgi:hypothetical protein
MAAVAASEQEPFVRTCTDEGLRIGQQLSRLSRQAAQGMNSEPSA